MKKIFLFLFSIFIFVSCEDEYKSSYSYEYSAMVNYPVYYDASDILVDIQVTPPVTHVSPYKIAFNDKYLFVGEMMKGIHVYEKTGEHSVSPLCFIECKLSKAFDVIDNLLFCNNFTDMLVINISNPLQATISHRQKNHFNNYNNYLTDMNIPYDETYGYIIDYKPFKAIITSIGEIADPKFSEADSMHIKKMPNSLVSGNPIKSKPYVGIAKYEKEIFTFGRYNSWAVCTYNSGFNVTEHGFYGGLRPIFPPPNGYYNNAFLNKLFYKDGFMCVIGSNYIDCGKNDSILSQYHFYFSDSSQIDVTVNTQGFFFILTKNHIRKTIYDDEYYEHSTEYAIIPGAVAITCSSDKIITLGDKLIVYNEADSKLSIIKEYPEISGTCMLQEDKILTIANTQGVFFYDISNVNDIKLIQ